MSSSHTERRRTLTFSSSERAWIQQQLEIDDSFNQLEEKLREKGHNNLADGYKKLAESRMRFVYLQTLTFGTRLYNPSSEHIKHITNIDQFVISIKHQNYSVSPNEEALRSATTNILNAIKARQASRNTKK